MSDRAKLAKSILTLIVWLTSFVALGYGVSRYVRGDVQEATFWVLMSVSMRVTLSAGRET